MFHDALVFKLGPKLYSRTIHVNRRPISHYICIYAYINYFFLMLYPMAGTKTEKKMTWILKSSTTYLLCVVVGESYVYSKEEESKLGTHEDFLFFPFFFLYGTLQKKHVFNFRTFLCWNKLGQHFFYSRLNSMLVFRNRTCIYFDIDPARNVFKVQLKKRSWLCITL